MRALFLSCLLLTGCGASVGVLWDMADEKWPYVPVLVDGSYAPLTRVYLDPHSDVLYVRQWITTGQILTLEEAKVAADLPRLQREAEAALIRAVPQLKPGCQWEYRELYPVALTLAYNVRC